MALNNMHSPHNWLQARLANSVTTRCNLYRIAQSIPTNGTLKWFIQRRSKLHFVSGHSWRARDAKVYYFAANYTADTTIVVYRASCMLNITYRGVQLQSFQSPNTSNLSRRLQSFQSPNSSNLSRRLQSFQSLNTSTLSRRLQSFQSPNTSRLSRRLQSFQSPATSNLKPITAANTS